MKNIIFILICLVVISCERRDQVGSVSHVDARKDNELIVKMNVDVDIPNVHVSIVNHTNHSIFLRSYHGEIGFPKMEIWQSGRGVLICAPNFADVYRNDAFVQYDMMEIKPNQSQLYSADISKFKPLSDENDNLASSVVGDVLFQKRNFKIRFFMDYCDDLNGSSLKKIEGVFDRE